MKDLCTRCTICCYYKTLGKDGTIVYSDRPCEFLDRESGLCIVYEVRTKMKQDCVRITRRVLQMEVLPPGCPYVRRKKGYKGPKLTPRLSKLADEAFGESTKGRSLRGRHV
jgi:uncharacterized cysteine cluster protein YcgN (CxxCxxCC family)